MENLYKQDPRFLDLSSKHIASSNQCKAIAGRGQTLNGNIIVSAWADGVWEVRFVKLKGDPLEWRRFFKNVCAGCRDAILRPDEL